MDRILVVEDDTLLNRGIRLALEKHKYIVSSAFTYSEGYTCFLNESFDLILLDIGLPDKNGIDLCIQIRKSSTVPIIFITANDTEQDMINGFLEGCDDYIAKPFSLEVLNHRIQAVLRRLKPENTSMFYGGKITIDYDRMLVIKEQQTINLTATEFKLLSLITKNRGQVLTRQIILERLWDVEEDFVDENAISVNIRRLRQKIEDDTKNPQYIKTVFGIGYTWGDNEYK